LNASDDDRESRDGGAAAMFGPNMVARHIDVTGSTFASMTAPHSLVTGVNWFNSLFNNTNFEGCTFHNSELDGALFENCSLRGVELRNCDIEGLIVNGFRIGGLLKLLMIEEGSARYGR
jgi:uncharacterized protein YjbI with pentapeptide repeats